MQLPNYFLVDLPPEAVLSAGMVQDACHALKRNRELYLRNRSTRSLIETISGLAASWLDREYPFRKLALTSGPSAAGFSGPTLGQGLDSFFAQLTRENIEKWIVQDLGHGRRMDEFTATKTELELNRAALVRGPEFMVHVAAGNIPVPSLASLIAGLLLRSAQFLKCGHGVAFLPRLFAHSLYESDPKLGACLELAQWRGGDQALETVLFSEADCVTVTGTDEALQSVRQRLRPHVRFVGYGHRVSFAYIARESLAADARRVIKRAVSDVVAWNQRGCLSPHVIYVERGGRVGAEELASLLAEELAVVEKAEPRGPLSDREAGVIASRRSFYEVRAAHSQETRLWCSPESTAWTVVYEADARFQISCLNRFLYVKPVADCTDALCAADSVRGRVSTVGLEAPEERVAELAAAFARWGATRICPLGEMQKPPLTWRHDGRPALGDLITWTDWERVAE